MSEERVSEERRTPAWRISVTRTGILVAVVLLTALAFTPWAGPLRILFRGVLILGVVVLALSHVGPWLRPLITRFRPKD